MNRQEPGIDVKADLTGCGYRPAHREPRSVRATRIGSWLADGLCIARLQPLMWVAAILGSADLATAFEFVAPFRLLATLLLAIIAGATILTPAGSDNEHRSPAGALRQHRDALLTVALACVTIVAVGELFSFALLHIKLTAGMTPSGAHSLSIIVGESNDRVGSLGSILNGVSLAVAIAAVWFSPALIILQGLTPLEAMLTSLRAVFQNGPVALVYATLLAADAALATAVPMLVRGLVLTPLLSALILLSMHGSYRDILSIDIAPDR